MKAGREMDALIHEKVMGWPKSPIFGVYEYPDGGYDFAPPYSTDIAAAWPVLERFPGGFSVTYNPNFNHYYCSLWKQNVAADAETAPLAICLAVLKAVKP